MSVGSTIRRLGLELGDSMENGVMHYAVDGGQWTTATVGKGGRIELDVAGENVEAAFLNSEGKNIFGNNVNYNVKAGYSNIIDSSGQLTVGPELLTEAQTLERQQAALGYPVITSQNVPRSPVFQDKNGGTRGGNPLPGSPPPLVTPKPSNTSTTPPTFQRGTAESNTMSTFDVDQDGNLIQTGEEFVSLAGVEPPSTTKPTLLSRFKNAFSKPMVGKTNEQIDAEQAAYNRTMAAQAEVKKNNEAAAERVKKEAEQKAAREQAEAEAERIRKYENELRKKAGLPPLPKPSAKINSNVDMNKQIDNSLIFGINRRGRNKYNEAVSGEGERISSEAAEAMKNIKEIDKNLGTLRKQQQAMKTAGEDTKDIDAQISDLMGQRNKNRQAMKGKVRAKRKLDFGERLGAGLDMAGEYYFGGTGTQTVARLGATGAAIYGLNKITSSDGY